MLQFTSILSRHESLNGLQRMPPISRCPLRRILHSTFLMPTSRLLLQKLSSRTLAVIPSFSSHLPCRQVILANPLRNTSRFISFSLKSPGFLSFSALSSSGTVLLEPHEGEELTGERLRQLTEKLEKVGIRFDHYKTGQYMRGLCPQCDGGDSKERSFALFIHGDGKLATWSCFRAKCGWRGSTKTSKIGEGYNVLHSFGSRPFGGGLKCKKYRTISDEDLHLEPLCPEIKAYFNARSISDKTLQRNSVMQRTWDDEIVIAFTYKRSGKLISCNYLDIEKRSWQEKDTESIFYGFDDIVPGNEIIIVDSEFDKLSMEEAGYRNCISVPNRKASDVSEKLPKEAEVWFCFCEVEGKLSW